MIKATQLVVVVLGFEPDPQLRLWGGVSCSQYVGILSSVGGVEGRRTSSSSLMTLGSLFHGIDKWDPCRTVHPSVVVAGGWRKLSELQDCIASELGEALESLVQVETKVWPRPHTQLLPCAQE